MSSVSDGKVLALDYGDTRIGIAISDALGFTAQPHPFVPNNENALVTIKVLIETHEINEIIIGMPYAQDGSKGKKCEDVDRFIELLADVVTLPITACDERFSTVAASRQLQSLGYNQKKQRGKIDSAAAAFMLQGYLDRKK